MGRYDGGDGTLSRAELEKMKAHEDFMLLSAVGMRHNIDSALELRDNRFWLAWFDFVPDILNLLNAISTLVWHRNYIPRYWTQLRRCANQNILDQDLALCSQTKHQNATASSLSCKGENAHWRQASFCFHMVSCFELFELSLVRERSHFRLWFGVIVES